MNKKIVVEMSLKNVAIIVLGIIGLFLIWKLQNIVFLVILAFIISSSLRPFVDRLEKRRIPRMLSIVIVYVVLLVFVLIGLATIFTQMLDQLTTLVSQIPELANNLMLLVSGGFDNLSNMLNRLPGVEITLDPAFIEQQIRELVKELDISSFSGGVEKAFTLINSTLSAIVNSLMVLTLSIYMLAKKDDIYSNLPIFRSKVKSKKYILLIKRIEEQLGMWLRGQLSLMAIIAIMTWIGLVVPSFFIDNYNLHKFALLFAIIAGLLEVVPNLGPIIATIISVVFAAGFNSSAPLLPVLYVGVLFTFIQQFEGAYLVPKVMEKAAGLDPVTTIIAFYAAINLFSVLGVVLIIPILAAINIIIRFELNEDSLLDK